MTSLHIIGGRMDMERKKSAHFSDIKCLPSGSFSHACAVGSSGSNLALIATVLEPIVDHDVTSCRTEAKYG